MLTVREGPHKHEMVPNNSSGAGMWCKKCHYTQEQLEAQAASHKAYTAAENEFGPFQATREMMRQIKLRPMYRNNYIVFDGEGKWIGYEEYGACLYNLQDMNSRVGVPTAETARFLWDWSFARETKGNADWMPKEWKRYQKHEPEAGQWYTWLANESPWAKVILTKSFEEAFHGGVMYSLDCTAEMLVTAAAGVRYIGEHASVPRTFCALLPHSPTPMTALLAAHHSYLTSDGAGVISHPIDIGHSMFNTSRLSEKGAKALVAGQFGPPEEPMYKRWKWANLASQFGPINMGARWLKLPETTVKWERDMFGRLYPQGGHLVAKTWMDQFQKELNKWVA